MYLKSDNVDFVMFFGNFVEPLDNSIEQLDEFTRILKKDGQILLIFNEQDILTSSTMFGVVLRRIFSDLPEDLKIQLQEILLPMRPQDLASEIVKKDIVVDLINKRFQDFRIIDYIPKYTMIIASKLK